MSTATDAIRSKVEAAVTRAAHNPNLTTTEAVTQAVTGPILHATNNEPWYQSRVTWGAIISVVIGLLGAFGVATDWIDPDQVTALALGVGSVIGGLVTLYGRWKARKPIGVA